MRFLEIGDSLTSESIHYVIEQIIETETVKKREHKTTIEYYNIPCAFDIETTSYYYNGQKCACMYIWQLGINGWVICGRTWNDFLFCMNELHKGLELSDSKRLLIYVHNLAFEFQFIRKLFHWNKVFAIDNRKPVQCITDTGIEFRCSYILSGYTLQLLSGQLHKYHVEKMVGDLDYSLPRHSNTPLTEKEMGYCINDVRVIMAYLQEKIENEGLANIPLTKTGYVRNLVRKNCLRGKHRTAYKALMDELTIEPQEYLSLKRAFAGGFTHANCKYVGQTIDNVLSADETSAYPSAMIAEKFPMSKGVQVSAKEFHSLKDFEDSFNRYCLVFDIELTDVEPKIFTDNPISASKCTKLINPIINNGRVVYAEKIIMTITEVDYQVFKKFYNWNTMRIGNIWRYEKAYLPTPFVECILKLYEDKTTLKGVKGREVDYLKGKEMLNSCYGMLVTDIIRDNIEYNGEWQTSQSVLEDEIDKYNNSKSRFIYYPWGVYVTAYARRNLFMAIIECGDDYKYSDTDSVKFTNSDKHLSFFKWYNNNIIRKLKTACKAHGIDESKIAPKTIKGIEKPLGVWDLEDGFYTKFKTLGAKRYMVEEDGKINITVSGVNKKKAVPYLYEKYKTHDEIFNAFSDGLEFPATYTDENNKIMHPTGKSTLTYIDEPINFVMKDYLGEYLEITALSGVHMENADYKMSLSEIFLEFLNGKTYLQ